MASVARTVRAIPTLLRIGVAETVAYRAEFLVWTLTTTVPLIMLAFWTSVARNGGQFAGYTAADFTAYFLANLIVRQLTSNWVGWQMSEEIRTGAMSMRLLRPLHPFVALTMSQIAAIPFRSMIAIPIAVILLATSGAHALTTDPVQLALVVPSIALAWIVNFGLMFAMGACGFWITQIYALGNFYFGLYMLLSGYMMPLDVLATKAPLVATIASWTPFPSMVDVPIRLLIRHLTHAQAVHLLGTQAIWAVVSVALGITVWRRGLRRFEAVGG
jgi:ABC-2 type transport system permease protein